MQNIYQVIGPPGTGKTTYLASQAKKAIAKYGTKSTMICSLTKAAAHEISKRDIPIAEDMVGTLHAHCFRSLGCPDLAEANLKQWNEEYPDYPMNVSRKGDVDDMTDTEADDILANVNVQRAQMLDFYKWPENTKLFWSKWEEWKEANGFLDFTDMIETCITDGGKAHGDPSILLGDEAQDWSKLEFKLFVDTWGAHADTIVLAGDFDQCIYSWRGAEPDYFMSQDIPARNRSIRGQSYRLPKTVHRRAVHWIRRIENREDVEYKPTDREGKVQASAITIRDPKELSDAVNLRTQQGKTCMILVSCSYMLNDIISEFKRQGIPFCNNYRRQNGAWNPLGRRKDAVMPVDRIASFLAPQIHNDEWRNTSMRQWTENEFRNWIAPLKTEIFKYGVKTKIKDAFFRIPEAFGEYNELFKEESDAHKSLFMDLKWYRRNLSEKTAKSIGYACEVASRYGLEGIAKVPSVTIGTIHSVKGGEADCVFLFPDLSRQGMENYKGTGKDIASVIRVFYVGMTRAKEELILCEQSTKLAVEF